MSLYTRDFEVKLLPYGSQTPEFKNKNVSLDLDSVDTVEELCAQTGMNVFLIVHSGRIVATTEDTENDRVVMKKWFTSAFPIILIECAKGFTEGSYWRENSNVLARLLHANVTLENGLLVLSRAFWQPGYREFEASALFLDHLVQRTTVEDYQRRTEVLSVVLPRRELQPVAPFNEFTRDLLPPPCLCGDPTGGHYIEEWADVPHPEMQSEELQGLARLGGGMTRNAAHIKQLSRAVVRVFGYHYLCEGTKATAATRELPVPFTGFFVSPTLILTARTGRFNAATGTFAHRFAFTRATRARHAMLRPDIDLFAVEEVSGVPESVAVAIRSLGVELADEGMPFGGQSVPWCDFMLLSVTHPFSTAQDTEYLLPEGLDCGERLGETPNRSPIERENVVAALHYPSKPSANFLQFQLDGDKGSGTGNPEVTAGRCERLFCGYECLCYSPGTVREVDNRRGQFKHTCNLVEGSRGCPLVRLEGGEDIATFCGIQVGRETREFEMARDKIAELSSAGTAARYESVASNTFNEAIPSTHTVLRILYIKFIMPTISTPTHTQYLTEKYLGSFSVINDKVTLDKCHRRMLCDADDLNEYGMDFYEHQDLIAAQSCFREGARMFTIASIPGLTEREIALKSALQGNLAAVVVARRNKEVA